MCVRCGDHRIMCVRCADRLPPPPQCYQSILRLQPDHAQALHNLCVVYVERGELARAETCLRRAAALAPDEAYIRRHLGIVEQRRRAAAAPNAAAESAPRPHASNSPPSET